MSPEHRVSSRPSSPSRHRRVPLIALTICVSLAACDIREAARVLRDEPATAYERYARALSDAGLASTAMGRDWLLASDSALRTPLVVSLPAREQGYYGPAEARAVAYRVALTEGQTVVAQLTARGLPVLLFVDLYEATGDSLEPFVHRATAESADAVASAPTVGSSASVDTPSSTDTSDTAPPADSAAHTNARLQFEVRRTGDYILRLQPELLRSGRYELEVRVQPMLAFPVEGGGNRSVQSLYGAARDAGRRQHHGIDIFAPRGTPVLAATNGVVRSVAPNNLGGNVVWLRDTARDQTLYYAHLDRHYVTAGDVVVQGDTIGFVGNTGNARTTRPHLHFGIYRRGVGPVDPWPYVRLETTSAPVIAADAGRLGGVSRTAAAAAPLLASPSARADTLQRVERGTPVQLVGAAGRWFRVQLPDGSAGYLAERAVRPANEGSAAGMR